MKNRRKKNKYNKRRKLINMQLAWKTMKNLSQINKMKMSILTIGMKKVRKMSITSITKINLTNHNRIN